MKSLRMVRLSLLLFPLLLVEDWKLELEAFEGWYEHALFAILESDHLRTKVGSLWKRRREGRLKVF